MDYDDDNFLDQHNNDLNDYDDLDTSLITVKEEEEDQPIVPFHQMFNQSTVPRRTHFVEHTAVPASQASAVRPEYTKIDKIAFYNHVSLLCLIHGQATGDVKECIVFDPEEQRGAFPAEKHGGKAQMSVTHLGPPLKQPESQLGIALFFAQQLAPTTKIEEHYKQSRANLSAIMSVITKKDHAFILQQPSFKDKLICHEFHSIDHCFARLSLFCYSKTVVWSLAFANKCFTIIADESSEPFCNLFVPETGDYHTFASLTDAKTCIEAAVGFPFEGGVKAYIWRPQPLPLPPQAEVVVVDVVEDVVDEVAPLPPPPAAAEEKTASTPAPPPQAGAAGATPSAPVKKKAVRKRPVPSTPVENDSSSDKKRALDQ